VNNTQGEGASLAGDQYESKIVRLLSHHVSCSHRDRYQIVTFLKNESQL